MTPFEPKKILCPVDLSPVSEGILRWAGLFARTLGAPLEVLYADWWEPPRYFTDTQIQQLTRQEQEGEKALATELEAVARAALGDLTPFNFRVVEGHPTERILEQAKESKAGLIVMGSHGRTGLARLRLGSVAEDVVRSSACPVLIVKSAEKLERAPTIRNILCPINFTSLSQRNLELASALAAALGTKLWVAHVTDHEEMKMEEVQQRVCDWVPKELRGRCQISEVVGRGNPAEQIILMAREHSCDLIVMGAQHRPFLEFTTLGTTTERVMRHSPTSLLVVPAGKTDTEN